VFSPQEFIDGKLLLVNKPLGWTSFDVVNKLRFTLRKYTRNKKIKVGHAGTLDPLATGLLIVCVGKYTKRINELQGLPKAYRATIKLGAETASYDAETPERETYPLDSITIETVINAMRGFVGEIDQYPPIFSAIKKDGIKLYDLARAGEEVNVESRKVTISKFELVENKWPEIVADIECSKGTYIRSLAHDLGKALDNGGYLTGLVRTSIGQYQLEDALEVEQIIESLKTTTQD
jgi:tRNA pseudouridine55 synthase